MRTRVRLAAAGGTVLLGITAMTGPVWAAETTPSTPTAPITVPVVVPAPGTETVKPSSTEASKARAAREIATRLSTLGRLSATVTGAGADCGHNAALTAELAASSAGLKTLGDTIKAETDAAKLKTEYQSIFQNFRVYLLEVPKTQTVVACDKVKTNSKSVTAWIAKAQTALGAAKAKGVDVSAAQTALDAVKPALDAAGTAAGQAAGSVMGLVPDKGDKAVLAANTTALKAAMGQIKTARSALDKALAAARQAIDALTKGQADAGHKHSTTSTTVRPTPTTRPGRDGTNTSNTRR